MQCRYCILPDNFHSVFGCGRRLCGCELQCEGVIDSFFVYGVFVGVFAFGHFCLSAYMYSAATQQQRNEASKGRQCNTSQKPARLHSAGLLFASTHHSMCVQTRGAPFGTRLRGTNNGRFNMSMPYGTVMVCTTAPLLLAFRDV